MALIKDRPAMSIMGLTVIVTSAVTFGLLDVTILNNTLGKWAIWIFLISFLGAYVLSDRRIGELEDYEAASFVIPIVVGFGVYYFPSVKDFVTQNSPWAGLLLWGLVFAGFYALSTNMTFQAVALEIIVGGVLLFTAAIQFELLSVEMLNSEIHVATPWIFIGTMAAAYFISERDIGRMSNLELSAIVVAVGLYVGYDNITTVRTTIQENNPQSGIIAVAVIALAYYYVMNDGYVKPRQMR